MERRNMLLIATIISRVLEPIVVASVLIVAASIRSGITGHAFVSFLGVVFFGMILPPVVFMIWAIKTGFVSNWDISNRHQRVGALFFFLISLMFDSFLIRIVGNNQLVRLFWVFIAWAIGFFLITLKWKISGHTGVLTLALAIGVVWFGLSWWVFLLVPVLGWARVVRRDHTKLQVIAGALYSLCVVLLCSSFIIHHI